MDYQIAFYIADGIAILALIAALVVVRKRGI